MGLLEDIGGAVSSFATTVTNDADAFVKGATNNVAQLFNSGVNSRGQVTGPLAEHFGKDPTEFIVNASKHFNAFFRTVNNRMAQRTGTAEFDEPAPNGRGRVKVKAKLTNKDAPAKVALVTALNAVRNPAMLVEEAGRAQQGLPVGRGLDGPYTYFPPIMPSLGGEQPRGFFGIDEAAAGAAAIAIIVAIAPAVITGLISIVGAIVPEVAAGIGNAINPPPPPPPPGLFGIEGLDPMMALIIVGSVVVGGYLIIRSRKG